MILDHDVPPDGEAQGQPYGHRVDHQGEVNMEQDHHAPAIAQLQLGRCVAFLSRTRKKQMLRDV